MIRRRSEVLLRVTAASALFTAVAAAQKVWVVAPVLGTGVDFTVIQDAVDAASDGDVVLVRAGTYAGFEIDGKGLTVAGDAPITLTDGSRVTVENTTAGQSVVVRGFSLTTHAFGALSIAQCSGPVTIEDCAFSLLPATAFFTAAAIAAAADVTLIDCRISAGTGLRGPVPALSVSTSNLHLFGCTIEGASSSVRSPGAAGATVASSVLVVAGTTLRGGAGASGVAVGGTCFLPPTDGGDALFLQAGATAYVLDSELVPGIGWSTAGCPPSQPGQAVGGGGLVHFMAGSAAGLRVASPVRGGQAVSLAMSGPPGSIAWLGTSLVQRPLFLRGCNGTFLVDLGSVAVLMVGAFPASGRLSLALPIPDPLGVEGAPVFMQLVTTDAVSGCVAGSPTALLLVDRRF